MASRILFVSSSRVFAEVHCFLGLMVRDLVLDKPDDLAAVGAAEHHRDPADDFLFAVHHGGALADGGPRRHFGYVPDEHGHPALGPQDDQSDVIHAPEQSDAADQVLLGGLLDDVSADVLVVPFQSLDHPAKRDTELAQLVRVDLDVILAEVAAEGVDLVDAGDGFQEWADRPILEGPELRQALDVVFLPGGGSALERVLVDFSHGRGHRPHGDLHAFRDPFLRFDQSLQDQLAGEVDVDPVLEDGGDNGQPEFGDRTDFHQAGQAAQARLHRIGDELLDLKRRAAGSGT